ncbi:uncharacterized protein EI90DRAFT_3289071 [Cantharellus anzutake]|uniref:uncharacterized protein n=1 Tax=Cantharellus anzutake TaxID=1750568 RepID=UPI0019055D1B|nr:uncharacterized protein EI90DRAFT_3289071 [Cantharellus anzutake]KAF8332356.1 hypothetical protein EI90DRAFT_3289071 [Cantharellus anzutake]
MILQLGGPLTVAGTTFPYATTIGLIPAVASFLIWQSTMCQIGAGLGRTFHQLQSLSSRNS